MDIKIKDMDLSGVTKMQQYAKQREENIEFLTSLSDKDKTDDEVIDELWDVFRVNINLARKVRGISTERILEGFQKNEDKIKARGYKPRKKGVTPL